VAAQSVSTGLENYRFAHNALPGIRLDEVDTSVQLFGKTLRVPLVVSSMTGGTPSAAHINQNLAVAAQRAGAAMAVGSQRTAIDNPSLAGSYRVRDVAPDILLFANLGAVQLNYGYGVDECRRAVEMIGADALILHLNPLQEALQRDGNTDFSGLLLKIKDVCSGLKVPVLVKEVGYGISGDLARHLMHMGVAGIDVAGAGGTSWSEVERHRLDTESEREVAAAFAEWGIPTAESIMSVRDVLPEITLIGSGGIRTGIDVAKVLALGADAAGMAGALLRPATISADAVTAKLQQITEQLRVAIFCTGWRSIADLSNPGVLVEVS
jgi:isopentenyl-diphosphate Delta-isomerase